MHHEENNSEALGRYYYIDSESAEHDITEGMLEITSELIETCGDVVTIKVASIPKYRLEVKLGSETNKEYLTYETSSTLKLGEYGYYEAGRKFTFTFGIVESVLGKYVPEVEGAENGEE